jgi:hypothetical protein
MAFSDMGAYPKGEDVMMTDRRCYLSEQSLATLKRGLVFCVALLAIGSGGLFGQNAGTGAISGYVSDFSGALIADATIDCTNNATHSERIVTSSSKGAYAVPQLQPGTYAVVVSRQGFKESKYAEVVVNVTETATLNIVLQVGSINETVEVLATQEQLQTETANLGQIVGGKELQSLPLVNRNYTQIIGLSPGVSVEVTNAGDLGRGNGGLPATGGISASGASVQDNNFQMNGVNVDDKEGSSGFSGGVPIPNPDTIQEFEVQTAAYDASYGRDGGANVNLVTKGGTNDYHGTLFEFFRNTALNANEFFRKELGDPRPVMQQNQFGFTFGGPIAKNRLTFFTSYQGTRQNNGVSSRCSTTFNEPALTNDRSRGALGALFAGQPTLAGGPTVAPDGSNISAPALALLNFKLPNGQYMIPTPQKVDATRSFANQGFSAVSQPCSFNENQYMWNMDWNQSNKSRWEERFFLANSNEDLTLNSTGFGSPAVPGFASLIPNHFLNASISHEYIFTTRLVNQVSVGYNYLRVSTGQQTPFTWTGVGVKALPEDNTLPLLDISGSIGVGGNGQVVTDRQNQYVLQDNLSWVKGRHTFRIGGGSERDDLDFVNYTLFSVLSFNSWPDFMIGQSGAQNGTGVSNVGFASDQPGILDRNYRVYDANLYAQDDFKVSSHLTLNFGLRFERLGDLGERNGRNTNIDFAALNPNPPVAGTFEGYVVPANYPKGAAPLPPGVIKTGSELPYSGDGQNTINPRVGFAWLLPGSNRFVLRGGWGLFHQALAGIHQIQQLGLPPWALTRVSQDPSFVNPFPANSVVFPSWDPSAAAYSPNSFLVATIYAMNVRPPSIEHYGLNLQTQITKDMLLELGYVGSRDYHLISFVLVNQALMASPSNPIRGETTNTVANVGNREPILGLGTPFSPQVQSTGTSWYNAAEASLSKRFSRGLQFRASYTWNRALETDPDALANTVGGNRIGNQFDTSHSWGPDRFIRPQRFIFSGVYELPSLPSSNRVLRHTLTGWKLAGVATIQSGDLLGVYSTNFNNVAGISGQGGDFAFLNGSCSLKQINNPGSVTSKLNNYINESCFGVNGTPGSYPIVGDDGLATGFGNSRPGIVHGPAQSNVDISLARLFGLNWPRENTTCEFRAEAFNAFNTPQFANPGTTASSSSFGIIKNTVVAPRIIQFAVKLLF